MKVFVPMGHMLSDLPRVLTELHEASGMTKTAAAKLCGVSPSYLGRMLAGEREISVSQLGRMLEAYGSDLRDIHERIARHSSAEDSLTTVAREFESELETDERLSRVERALEDLRAEVIRGKTDD